MMTKPPKVYFSEWQVAALITITIVIVLSSSSPRTGLYSITIIAVLFFLANGILALVSRLFDLDQ
jgi:hypothetical protein